MWFLLLPDAPMTNDGQWYVISLDMYKVPVSLCWYRRDRNFDSITKWIGKAIKSICMTLLFVSFLWRRHLLLENERN